MNQRQKQTLLPSFVLSASCLHRLVIEPRVVNMTAHGPTRNRRGLYDASLTASHTALYPDLHIY